MIRRGVVAGVVCVVAALAVSAPRAQQAADFPTRTVSVIGYSNPGGPLDLLARLLADALKAKYAKSVIVENRTGAAGITASLYVKNQPPDGHTLFYGTMTTALFAPQIRPQVPYDTRKDFTAIALTMGYALILVGRPDLPFKTLDEMVAYAKASPGKLNYATNGFGAWTHIAMELYQERLGAKLTHVPFTGHAPAMQALLGGQIDLAMVDINIAMPHIQDGKIKVIGQLDSERTPQFPDTQTFGEKVPELATPFWLGIFGPPNMPGPLVARINKDINEVTDTPAMRERAAQAYMKVQTSTPETFSARVAKEWEFWGKVVRENNLIMKQ